MALGGGTFTSQNKELPGAYINFVSAASASAALSDRGIATMPLELDWGVEGEVFEVTNEDFQKNSLKLFGYAFDSPKMLGLNDLFMGAKTLYAYRLNGGGDKAANTYATAKYCGVRGNDLKIVIQKNADDASKYDVTTYFGTVKVDTQTVAKAADLVANDYVTFKAADLAVTAGTPLTGGTNGTVDGTAHQAYLDKIESYTYNTMGVVVTDDVTKKLYVAFNKRLRDELGIKFQLVVYNLSADYMGVISVKNKVTDTGWSEAALVYWVTGAESGCAVNKSCQNKKYDGGFTVDTNYTQNELKAAIKTGEFTFHKVNGVVRVLEDINSIKNSYGDTAAREFLILLAKDRGLSPEPATKAILQGEFTPTNIDVTGKRFNIGEINYVVTEQITPGTYKVQCETEGVVGNQYLGDMIPMEYIDGLQTASLTSVLIPGEDEEDTEVFRQRYFDSFNEQSFGGNHADYMAKVKGIEGVGSCKVKRVWNGDIRPADMIVSTVVKNWYESIISTVPAAVKPWLTAVYNAAKDKKLTVGGTVHVVITDSDDYGEASSTLVQYVQHTLDPEETAGEGYGLAPIGHVVSVASASPVSIEVKTTVTFEEGHNWSNTKAAIAEAVDAYFLELRKNWSETSQTIVRVSQIENRILGVDGVVDVTGTKLNGTASNMTLTEFCIPKLGGVSA